MTECENWRTAEACKRRQPHSAYRATPHGEDEHSPRAWTPTKQREVDLPVRGRGGCSYLHSFRLGPWDRETSVACFERLAESYRLVVDEGVAAAVYRKLGMGIPHHIQSFFSRLQDDAIIRGVDRLTLESVERVYRTFLLGPSGHRDLLHYETRLRDH